MLLMFHLNAFTVSEEGSSHLTEDVWAQKQNQIGEIDEHMFHGHVKSQDEEVRERSTENVQEPISHFLIS